MRRRSAGPFSPRLTRPISRLRANGGSSFFQVYFRAAVQSIGKNLARASDKSNTVRRRCTEPHQRGKTLVRAVEEKKRPDKSTSNFYFALSRDSRSFLFRNFLNFQRARAVFFGRSRQRERKRENSTSGRISRFSAFSHFPPSRFPRHFASPSRWKKFTAEKPGVRTRLA